MSVYWVVATLTGLSGQDIGTPDARAEVFFTIGVMFVGFMLVASFIGNVSMHIANMNSAEVMFRNKMDVLSHFMKYRGVPAEMQRKIMSYYDYVWSRQQGLDDKQILQDLPAHMQAEIAIFLNREILTKVPLFAGSPVGFINQLATTLKPRVYAADEYICSVNEIGREMFFIRKGVVEVVSADGNTVFNTMCDGQYFGEIALLVSGKRTASVRARTYVDVYTLSREDLEQVLVDFPEMHARIREVAQMRILEGNVPVSPSVRENASAEQQKKIRKTATAIQAVVRMQALTKKSGWTGLKKLLNRPNSPLEPQLERKASKRRSRPPLGSLNAYNNLDSPSSRPANSSAPELEVDVEDDNTA
eukprot:CAMPEP_0184362128 /NCGR_PEP_ID=MMETSP1089-20130417/133451_1 /TAXON_ID=38269 ORGANISM="Gloeochaete wittrockiana, Strain SAG46.84" /NCGR_SAMPLE_ID=MMETSP1089 /ASSEMBLY_ACC=CAM_ASM_000445 /LENGTH=359 /DNA_ID=CAMNT_0026702079 /DNA_START=726 /DNA_END=1801 /DNA_ORIENTATION=+